MKGRFGRLSHFRLLEGLLELLTVRPLMGRLLLMSSLTKSAPLGHMLRFTSSSTQFIYVYFLLLHFSRMELCFVLLGLRSPLELYRWLPLPLAAPALTRLVWRCHDQIPGSHIYLCKKQENDFLGSKSHHPSGVPFIFRITLKSLLSWPILRLSGVSLIISSSVIRLL